MHRSSKLSIVLLPDVLVPLLVLAAGVLIGRAEPWGPSFDALVSAVAWGALGLALAGLVVRMVTRVARDLPAADDDDPYYRHKRGQRVGHRASRAE